MRLVALPLLLLAGCGGFDVKTECSPRIAIDVNACAAGDGSCAPALILEARRCVAGRVVEICSQGEWTTLRDCGPRNSCSGGECRTADGGVVE